MFAIGHRLVCVVWVWILQNHVPGVEETREETEAREAKVYERISATNALLHPNTYRWELWDMLAIGSHELQRDCRCLPPPYGTANVPGR